MLHPGFRQDFALSALQPLSWTQPGPMAQAIPFRAVWRCRPQLCIGTAFELRPGQCGRFLPANNQQMNTVTVNKRGADRIRGGHLWIYRSERVQKNQAAGGSVVVARDQKGNFVGQAFFSDSSQIALRFLSETDEPIDREWWNQRISESDNRRANKIGRASCR